jgi:hypothetical protein
LFLDIDIDIFIFMFMFMFMFFDFFLRFVFCCYLFCVTKSPP